jgi:hypothetical protein
MSCLGFMSCQLQRDDCTVSICEFYQIRTHKRGLSSNLHISFSYKLSLEDGSALGRASVGFICPLLFGGYHTMAYRVR